MTTNHMKAGL